MNERITLVTGANRGIGFEIAKLLAGHETTSKYKDTVYLAARNSESGQKSAHELQQLGLNVHYINLDVADEQSRIQAIHTIHNKHGRLDVLINNAGVALDKWQPSSDLNIDTLRQTMEINVYACLHLIQLCLPHMRKNGYGRIVNMSSELASLSRMEMGLTLAYRLSKSALNTVTKIVSLELIDTPNIKINSAAPGWVKTELGGHDAPLTPEQGADTPVWLACLPESGPSGEFFRERKRYPW